MSAPPFKQMTLCDRQRLIRYLDAELSSAEQTALESHLSDCNECRQAIEHLAADGEFWKSATKALESRPNEFGAESSDAFAHLTLGALANREVSDANDPQLQSQLNRQHDTWRSDLVAGDSPTETSLSQSELLARWLDPSDADGSVGRIGKYEVQGVVGQGGMGLVLKAFDTELNRWVALKTLAHHITPQRSAEIDAGLRLAREARAVAALRHPHIISIYGLETWRSVPLIVMPLIDGGTLQQWAAAKPLQIEQALSTAIQIASALAALHAAGIVHRDLKPSNILLQGDLEHVLISDFGLARIDGDVAITHSNALAGTPFFMSPEQALGKPVDARSDLFSFGCVLFWMFAGKYPFRGGSNYETLSRLIHTEPNFTELDKRQVPEYLQRLIKRLLAKEPNERWSDSKQVCELLQAASDHFRSPDSPLPRELAAEPRVHANRNRLLAVSLIAIPVLLLAMSAQVIYRMSTSYFSAGDSSVATQPNGASEVAASSAITNSQVRYGTLDELDRKAMFSDFAAATNLHYWLRRMAYLPVDEIPPEALPTVQALSTNSDATIRELAAVILNKNPFQEIHVIQTIQTETNPVPDSLSTKSPFEEVLADE